MLRAWHNQASIGGTKSAKLWEIVKITAINTTMNEMSLQTCWRVTKKKKSMAGMKEQGEWEIEHQGILACFPSARASVEVKVTERLSTQLINSAAGGIIEI